MGAWIFNLLTQHIILMNALKRYRSAKRYLAKLNLSAKVQREISPKLAAKRKADDLLERCTRESVGIESQGYSNALGCSRMDIHTFGHMRGSESLVSNDTFEACALAGMCKAEDGTRNVADNN